NTSNIKQSPSSPQQNQQLSQHPKVDYNGTHQVEDVPYAESQIDGNYPFQASSRLSPNIQMEPEANNREQQPQIQEPHQQEVLYQIRTAPPAFQSYINNKQQQFEPEQQVQSQLSTYEPFLKFSVHDYEVSETETVALNLSSMDGKNTLINEKELHENQQVSNLLHQVNVTAAMAVVVTTDDGGNKDREP
ncbi:hypothetical protein KR074_009754, partial [Drosophila pseudoananassae]